MGINYHGALIGRKANTKPFNPFSYHPFKPLMLFILTSNKVHCRTVCHF